MISKRSRNKRLEFLRIDSSMAMSDYEKKLYHQKKDAYEASPEGIAERKRIEAIQAAAHEQENLRVQKLEELKNLSNYMLQNIIAELGLNNINGKEMVVDEQKAKEVMQKYASSIEYLTQNSKKLEKIAEGKNNYIYIKFYKDLIAENKVFIKLAPIEVFYYSSNLLKTIPVANFVENKQFFIDNGYFKDAEFSKANSKYFTGIKNIASMYNVEQVKRELAEDASLYTDVNKSVKMDFFNSNITLRSLLQNNNDVFMYFSPEEMVKAGQMCSTTIGKMFLRHPEYIAVLPDDYFNKVSVVSCFAGLPKAQVHSVVKDYYKTFPSVKYFMKNYLESLEKQKEKQKAEVIIESTPSDGETISI